MGIVLFGIIVFIVLFCYCACIVAGRYDDASKPFWEKEDK